MDITGNKHAGPSLAIANKQPVTLSEAVDEQQLNAWIKPEGESSPSITTAQESQTLIMQQQQQQQQQRNQLDLQPLQKNQENEQQQQQPEPAQPNPTNTRIGSVSRSISINKVRQSTSELETLLTDMKALRKTPNARSKPVLATSIASRVSALTTTVEPVREPSTARISYISMASIESAAGVNVPMSKPPRFSLPVMPLASKRQSQISQEFQFQQQLQQKQQETELYGLDRFSDAVDVATIKNDALSEDASASSPLPATPVRKKFSFPHQHQRNQSYSSATSVHTLGDAILAIVNNKSNSTIVDSNRNSASSDDLALNLVLPPRRPSAIAALERQITGSSVDSSIEGYYTPAEENSTAANTPTTVTHNVDYNTFTPGSAPRDNSMASPLFSIPKTRLGEKFNHAATNVAVPKAMGMMSSGETYGETPFTMPTPVTPVVLSRRAQTFPLTLSPSTVIANREYDKLQREKRKASAATVVVPAMSAGSASSSTTASAMAFHMLPLLQDPAVSEMSPRHGKSSGGNNAAAAAAITNNCDNVEALELPPTERVLIDKFVTALARLSTEMTDDEHKRPEGLRRLHNALKAIEGWI
ncbi:hypothetical protein D0Z00_000442 [Geotrichum galactomycetum]|uniref:Uncharacterized protein n=1 Tax=Geotrichum galactomycetum TaxID=27317 RepID=A0ACB6V9N8_9ASCO|nr:hypothetical protein D0Z00_000442 [Geotrichum candidum]